MSGDDHGDLEENEWVALDGTLTFFDGNENSKAVPVKRVEPTHHFCSIGHLMLWLNNANDEKRKEIADE